MKALACALERSMASWVTTRIAGLMEAMVSLAIGGWVRAWRKTGGEPAPTAANAGSWTVYGVCGRHLRSP